MLANTEPFMGESELCLGAVCGRAARAHLPRGERAVICWPQMHYINTVESIPF